MYCLSITGLAVTEKLGNYLDSLKTVIMNLKSQVEELSKLRTDTKSTVDKDSLIEEIVNEIDDPNRRKRNILIVGSEQPSNIPRTGRLAAESKGKEEVLKCVSSNFSDSSVV